MTTAVAQLLQAATHLSLPERAELADHLAASLVEAQQISPDIEQAHLSEVRRRIAQVDSGEVMLIPGEEALAQVRQRLASARAAS